MSVALLLLWLSGVGFVVLGYLDDPGYIENQKIWAKVSIVLLMSLNGIYIHRTLLPRLMEVSQGGSLIHDATESATFRLSFAVSIAGWLLAAFYGTAKFLNQGYQYSELFGLYLLIVVLLLAFAVGGGLWLVMTERKARRTQRNWNTLKARVRTLKAEGMELPEGVRVQVVENTAQDFTLVIPAQPTDLSDEELVGAAGGAGSCLCAFSFSL